MWGGFYSLFIVYSIYYMFMGMLEAMDSALIFPFSLTLTLFCYVLLFLVSPVSLYVSYTIYTYTCHPNFFLFVLTVITLVCYLFVTSFLPSLFL